MKSADTKVVRVKISGVFRLGEIDWINRIQPDYVEFVFYKSYCRVGLDQAEYLKRKLLPGIQAVGSFSCLSCWLIADLLGSGVIDAANIQGECTVDEMEQMRRHTDKPLIKTVYLESEESIAKAQEYPVDYLVYDCKYDQEDQIKQCLNILHTCRKQKKEFFLSERLCSVSLEQIIAKIKPYGININSPMERKAPRDPEQIGNIIQRVREMKIP